MSWPARARGASGRTPAAVRALSARPAEAQARGLRPEPRGKGSTRPTFSSLGYSASLSPSYAMRQAASREAYVVLPFGAL
eukprot:9065402-Alexandrium_andersonii.AAC.1